MKRLVPLLLSLLLATQLAAATTWKVTTWNLEWFPSGKPDYRDEKIESERTAGAAAMLREPTPDIILLKKALREIERNRVAKETR